LPVTSETGVVSRGFFAGAKPVDNTEKKQETGIFPIKTGIPIRPELKII
jgi:hypothetical protein